MIISAIPTYIWFQHYFYHHYRYGLYLFPASKYGTDDDLISNIEKP
jgi:hypothetical protein